MNGENKTGAAGGDNTAAGAGGEGSQAQKQPEQAPQHPILGMNADQAKAFVADQALEDLDALEAAEKTNQKNPNGRVSVLKAITERRAKLTQDPEADSDQQGKADQLGDTRADSQAEIEIVPETTGNKSDEAIDLLLATCEKFGVHPSLHQRPRELQAWRFYPGNRVDGIPAAVVIVTAGGRKVKNWADPSFPMDSETEEILRNLFNAWGTDPVTKQPIPKPLPDKLLLPDAAVTGQEPTGADKRYRYVGGYLRNGGKVEAAKRGRI